MSKQSGSRPPCFDLPRPRTRSQKANTVLAPNPNHSPSGACLSPVPRHPLHPPYLPTPSPSPSLSNTMSSSPASKPDLLDPFIHRLHNLSFSPASFVPTPPHSPLPFNLTLQPPPYDMRAPVMGSLPSFDGDFGSDSDHEPAFPRTGSNVTSGRLSYEAFRQTRSRVIRVFNLPSSSSATALALSRLFSARACISADPASAMLSPGAPLPVRMWALREDWGGARAGEEDGVWAVFRTHEEACAALSLSGTTLSIATALETDLEPFAKLRKFEVRNNVLTSQSALAPAPGAYFQGRLHLPPSPQSPMSPLGQRPGPSAHYELYDAEQSSSSAGGYQLSSNPPNPRPVFRAGDWICASANCAAHNFGRNVACIGCGYPRPVSGPPSPSCVTPPYSSTFATRLASPRFAGHPAPGPSAPAHALSTTPSPTRYTFPINIGLGAPLPPHAHTHAHAPAPKPPAPAHPLLTPSGRALAAGGKVHNVSSDPLAPCIIYWPDNEPFPEQGQIRPGGLGAVQQPPILNTGNRGPIEHQPGDWVCQKCDYLNWRRRKVCQTCFPYAEGNGDSVSAVVQAERIALLASVFAQSQAAQPHVSPETRPFPLNNFGSRFSSSPTSVTSPYASTSLAQTRGTIPRPQLSTAGSQWAIQKQATRLSSTPSNISPGNIVYQTPAALAIPSFPADEPPPGVGALLPSFLKHELKPALARTPSSLSPSSTSSADLSFDEYDDDLASPASFGRPSGFYAQQIAGSDGRSSGSTSSLALGGGNIWAMDRDEKPWSAAALPSADGLVGARSRTSSLEGLS